MSTDALSLALQQRRGAGIDPGLFIGESTNDPNAQATIDVNLPMGGESQHTPVLGETGAPTAMAQSVDVEGDDELQEMTDEMGGHVMDHGTADDYQRLKGMKPRSLGERAKMEQLTKKFGN